MSRHHLFCNTHAPASGLLVLWRANTYFCVDFAIKGAERILDPAFVPLTCLLVLPAQQIRKQALALLSWQSWPLASAMTSSPRLARAKGFCERLLPPFQANVSLCLPLHSNFNFVSECPQCFQMFQDVLQIQNQIETRSSPSCSYQGPTVCYREPLPSLSLSVPLSQSLCRCVSSFAFIHFPFIPSVFDESSGNAMWPSESCCKSQKHDQLIRALLRPRGHHPAAAAALAAAAAVAAVAAPAEPSKS